MEYKSLSRRPQTTKFAQSTLTFSSSICCAQPFLISNTLHPGPALLFLDNTLHSLQPQLAFPAPPLLPLTDIRPKILIHLERALIQLLLVTFPTLQRLFKHPFHFLIFPLPKLLPQPFLIPIPPLPLAPNNTRPIFHPQPKLHDTNLFLCIVLPPLLLAPSTIFLGDLPNAPPLRHCADRTHRRASAETRFPR